MSVWRRLRTAIVTAALFMPAAVLWLARVRFGRVTNLDRIGHLAAEPDAYLKQKRLGMAPMHFGILVAPYREAANQTLLALWRQQIPTISSPFLVRMAFLFLRFKWLWLDFNQYADPAVHRPSSYFEILARWGGRPPVLHLPSRMKEDGDRAARSLGLPEGAWYVCVHVREAGYSPRDDAMHAFRNSRMDNFLRAVDEVAARGGWCVRMGDASTTPLSPHPRFIDYAHSPLRSDWMDIYLASQCRLFVGTTSGLVAVPGLFGRPSVRTNIVPVSCIAQSPFDISIPRLVEDIQTRQLWTFSEMAIGEYFVRYSARAEALGIEIRENTPEDILAAVREALEELDGREILDEADRRRMRRYFSIYPEGHIACRAQSRISPSFLRKYEALLPPG